jgi:hypothetical protein
VPTASVGVNNSFVSGRGRLHGWSMQGSLTATNAIEASLQGVAAAAATLTLTGFVGVTSVTVTPAAAWPAGASVVTVNNVTGGPIIAQIEGGTTNAVVITFIPTVGVAGTPNVVVPAIAAGPAYTIDASGQSSVAGTATPVSAGQFVVGGQVVGCVAALEGATDTRWLSEEGVYLGGPLSLTVTTGQLSGVAYITDEWHGGSN